MKDINQPIGCQGVIIILMKLPALFALLLFAGFLFLLTQSFLETRARGQRLELLRAEVGALDQKAQEKQKELDYRRSAEFIEKEAREQLGYARSDEVIVVLPDVEAKAKSPEALAKGGEEKGARGPSKSEPAPYWKQWRALFFGN